MDTALKGGPELMAFLDSLPSKLATNVLRGGLRAAARVVADEAIARTNSSEIAAGIKVSTGSQGGLIRSKVKLKGYAASLGIWAEFGTAQHIIAFKGTAPVGKNLPTVARWNKLGKQLGVHVGKRPGSLRIGNNWVGNAVIHPGAREMPFLRPALDTKAEAAVEAMAGYIRARFDRQDLDAPDFGVDDEDDDE